MQLLHLCSDYSGTPLYNSLIYSLSKYCTFQSVYVPVRSIDLLNKYQINGNPQINIIYSLVLKKWHRIFFKKKIHDVYKDMTTKLDLLNLDLIHAHFLFSDGALAYAVKKNIGIAYVVTVRNTDINIFIKYFLHLRTTGISILKNAKSIIVLNPKYKEKLLSLLPKTVRDEIVRKIFIIPNGLDSFWIKNKNNPKSIAENKQIKVLYVGEFSKNKNIENSIKSIEKLRNDGIDIEFALVGNYGNDCKRIKSLQKKRSKFIKIVDRVSDKNILLDWYRNYDIFLMPSLYESFGLVYLEAMSQGCPVVYSKNQGIDGYFVNGHVGYSVDPYKIESIYDAIINSINNYSKLSQNCIRTIEQFSWERVALATYEAYEFN